MATSKMLVTSIALAAGLVQVASASAVKRWGVPLPACTPATPFVYAGCFSDMGSTDALEYRSEVNSNTMTIEACVAFCKGNPRLDVSHETLLTGTKETIGNMPGSNTTANVSAEQQSTVL
jgi:hypothetical protein